MILSLILFFISSNIQNYGTLSNLPEYENHSASLKRIKMAMNGFCYLERRTYHYFIRIDLSTTVTEIYNQKFRNGKLPYIGTKTHCRSTETNVKHFPNKDMFFYYCLRLPLATGRFTTDP